jgi:hypothetical protein
MIGEDGLPLALDPEAFGDGEIDLLDLLPEADELFLDEEVDATPAFDGAAGNDGAELIPVSRRRTGPTGTPAQEAQFAIALSNARAAERRVRQLDPTWQPPSSVSATITGQIADLQARASAAEARYNEITRDAIPGTNPSWGVNRLRKELREMGFEFVRPTDSPGMLLRNPSTSEEVRIMERPSVRYKSDPPVKHYHDFYYRYRLPDGRWGSHMPIPNKG